MFWRTVEWVSDNGMSVSFGTPPFMLRDVTDSLGAEAQTVRAPGRDGAVTYGAALGCPVINVTGSVHASGATLADGLRGLDAMCDLLRQAFLPDSAGFLTERRHGRDRRIRCRPVALPTLGPRVGLSRSVDIELTADRPLWEAADETSVTLGREAGMFRFPLRLPSRMGTYYKEAVVTNGGGADIWPVVEIRSTFSLVRVENATTGRKVEINRPVGQGERLVLDMLDASARILSRSPGGAWEESGDASHLLTADSEYWPLAPGTNVVRVSNEIPGDAVAALLRYREPM